METINLIRRVHIWITASRPHTLSAAVVPVLVGNALALREGVFDGRLFAVTLLAALLVQIGANLTDEFADHDPSASPKKFPAPHKVIARGLLSAAAVRTGAVLAFGAATLLGGWLVLHSGWPLLLLCFCGLAVAYGYSAGPWPLGDYGLGEVLVFLLMGPAMVLGAFYIQAGYFLLEALWLSLSVGALAAAILVVNNLRDEAEDWTNRRRTSVTLMGAPLLRAGYVALLGSACLPPAWLMLHGAAGPALALPCCTAPLLLRLSWQVLQGRTRPTLHRALKGTSALHLVYGLTLAAALLWDASTGKN